MPALTFQPTFLDALLRGDKQQTTRPLTDRFKVGDVCHVYNQQRRRIIDKPLRTPTRVGAGMIFQMIEDEGRYPRPECDKSFGYSIDPYYAHFLGKVIITEVYDIHPCDISLDALTKWAQDDGFKDLADADIWFTKRYGDCWDTQYWTVVCWHGWIERYFEAEAV